MVEILGKVYMFAAFVVWLGISFYTFRVVKLRKPGVNIWRATLWNPFNLILMSSKLTKDGLKARKNLFVLILVFVAMGLVPLLGNAILG
jgi:hypothetical protein